jgi:hypothetical protein
MDDTMARMEGPAGPVAPDRPGDPPLAQMTGQDVSRFMRGAADWLEDRDTEDRCYFLGVLGDG